MAEWLGRDTSALLRCGLVKKITQYHKKRVFADTFPIVGFLPWIGHAEKNRRAKRVMQAKLRLCLKGEGTSIKNSMEGFYSGRSPGGQQQQQQQHQQGCANGSHTSRLEGGRGQIQHIQSS